MATDATGTPTPKGIPTYDTANDAPSGLGFNAAMAVIDSLLGWAKARKNSTGIVFSRSRFNFIEGTGVSITMADDATNNEINVTIAAAGGGGGNFIPIEIRNAQSASNAGNAFPAVITLADYELWCWAFKQDTDGKVFGICRIPENVTPSNPQIILEIGANATTGVTRLSVATKAIANGESMNPSALTSEPAQDITVPGTARLRKKVSFNVTEPLEAGDLVVVEIFHEGAHANDTLAVATELYGAYLKAA